MQELQAVIEALAERLHRAVAIDDPDIHLIAHTAHNEDVDSSRVESVMKLSVGAEITDYAYGFGIRTSTGPVRMPPRPDLGMFGRVCIPIRCQTILLGYLWLIDNDETLTEEELADSCNVAAQAGEILFRNRLLDDLKRQRERELLLDILHSESDARGPLSTDVLSAEGLDPTMHCRVVLVRVLADTEDLDRDGELAIEMTIRRFLEKLSRTRRLITARRGGWGYALIAFRQADDPSADLVDLAGRIRADLLRSAQRPEDVFVGIGPAVTGVLQAPLSHRRAVGVIEVCRSVAGIPAVSTWEDLGVYKVLNELPLDELADVAIPEGLRRLIAISGDQWLFETLETYLDAAGNVQESARLLKIHRATLYYRLSKIEQVTGMSLADGGDRLDLHLGIRLAHLMGETPGSPSADVPAAQGDA